MTVGQEGLASTVEAMRPMVPAKNFDISQRFYSELGFHSESLTEGLVEMRLGACIFILQDYYVQQWADNLVIHLTVSDLELWWDHIIRLDLSSRYGVKICAPHQEDWGVVAGIVDPSGVLWRIAAPNYPRLRNRPEPPPTQ